MQTFCTHELIDLILLKGKYIYPIKLTGDIFEQTWRWKGPGLAKSFWKE